MSLSGSFYIFSLFVEPSSILLIYSYKQLDLCSANRQTPSRSIISTSASSTNSLTLLHIFNIPQIKCHLQHLHQQSAVPGVVQSSLKAPHSWAQNFSKEQIQPTNTSRPSSPWKTLCNNAETSTATLTPLLNLSPPRRQTACREKRKAGGASLLDRVSGRSRARLMARD